MTKLKKIAALGAIGLMAGAGLVGCDRAAEKANYNLSESADNFDILRHITVVNGITDKPLFEAVGYCSVNDQDIQLELICRDGSNAYSKHMFGLSDNITYSAVQVDSADVSIYHTQVRIRPETLFPELNLDTGRQ